MTADPHAGIVARVLASRRYGRVAPELVQRLAAEEAPKARNPAEAEKRVKRRLHQIFGAYTAHPDYSAILAGLQHAADAEERRHLCRAAMAEHASTRERLPIIDDFYRELFAVTGRPASLLDIGCGLNPLAIPWMDLVPTTPYHALDIDIDLVAFLNDALPLLGVSGRSETSDVVATPPVMPCDVALLLKAVPCLEQQRAGIGVELLRSLPARCTVVTYPTRSLGGHGKGMARTYRAAFARIAATLERAYTTLEFPGELAFVLGAPSPPGPLSRPHGRGGDGAKLDRGTPSPVGTGEGAGG